MLPKNLKYGSKIESAPAKSTRINIAPQNGTGPYNLGDTIILNIPTRANTVLVPSESYLKFTVNSINGGYTAGNNQSLSQSMRWDGSGAHGVIQRIRVWHGSNLLQDIDNYGLLSKMIFDLQVATPSAYGKFNMLCGTRNDLVTLPVASVTSAVTAATEAINLSTVNAGAACVLGTMAATDAASTAVVAVINQTVNACTAGLHNPTPVQQISGGEYLISNANNNSPLFTSTTDGGGVVTYAYSRPVTYCLNLISLIGTLCNSHYFPTFACTSAPLRVEIQLVDQLYKCLNISGVTAGTALSYPSLRTASNFLYNVEYIASFIELGDEAMQMIESSLEGEPLQFVFGDYRNYQYTYSIPNGSTTQVNMPIPAKFSSLKSLFVCTRDQGTGAYNYYPFSTVNYGLVDYYFRIGPNIKPAKAPNTYAEYFSELIKAIGSMSDIHYSPNIEKISYNQFSSVANTATADINGATNIGSGRFFIGLDLENYTEAPKDSIFAGWNSNTDDIFAVMDFNTTVTNPLIIGNASNGVTNYSLVAGLTQAITMRFDAYALFDTVIVFENGTSFVRY